MKQQMNVRISNVTRQQIEKIKQETGMTEGEIVALGIERLDYKQVGNLSASGVIKEAAGYGFTKYLGGTYSWRDYRASGKEFFAGACRDIEELKNAYLAGNDEVGFKKELEGTKLPSGVWYCEKSDTLMICKGEDYGLGQSSRMYFHR